MQHIAVRELVGENAMTMGDGEVIFRQIHDPLARGETVQLDFGGVEIFASPFFNASIGRLLADFQPDILNSRLEFQHMSALGDRVLRRVIENAKEYYAASSEQRRSIDRIVMDSAAVV